MSQDLASLVDKEVLYQEAKAELTVARAATVACLAWAVMAIVGRHSADPRLLWITTPTCVVLGAYYGLVVPRLVRSRMDLRWLRRVNVTLEVAAPVALLGINLFLIGPVYALTAKAPLAVFVTVVLSGFRLRPWLSAYAGVLGAGLTALFGTLAFSRLPPGALQELPTLGAFFVVLQVVFILCAGMVAAFMAHRARTTVTRVTDKIGDQQRTQEIFGRYVTPELAQRFLDDPDQLQLGGRRQQVTVMFTDLRGFTSLSEHMPPEELVSLLNLYFSRMTELIEAHGGLVNEFMGDGILVLFGAPDPGPDDALRAVRCAVDMQLAMVDFNATSAAEGRPRLEMGVGINSGEVVAGNIGSERRQKYAVVGAPVNLAARVEALTVGGQVLITEATWALTQGQVQASEPIRVAVKGGAEPLAIYEVTGVHGDPPLSLPKTERTLSEVVLGGTVQRVLGKQIDTHSQSITITRLGPNSAQISGAEDLPPLQDVVLSLDLPGQGRCTVYAKVWAERGQTTLRFTSVTPEDRQKLERV